MSQPKVLYSRLQLVYLMQYLESNEMRWMLIGAWNRDIGELELGI